MVKSWDVQIFTVAKIYQMYPKFAIKFKSIFVYCFKSLFNDTWTLMGHFVSFPSEREKGTEVLIEDKKERNRREWKKKWVTVRNEEILTLPSSPPNASKTLTTTLLLTIWVNVGFLPNPIWILPCVHADSSKMTRTCKSANNLLGL